MWGAPVTTACWTLQAVRSLQACSSTSSNTELPVSREEGVRTRAAGDGDDKDGVVGHVEGGEPQDDHVHGGQTNTIEGFWQKLIGAGGKFDCGLSFLNT